MTTATQSLGDQCRELKALRETESESKSIYEDAKAKRELAELELLDRLDAEESRGHKTSDGTNFVLSETVYGQITDRAEFVAWAQEHDDALIEPRERKALLNELVRERLDNGEAPPPGANFYVKRYISMRAA